MLTFDQTQDVLNEAADKIPDQVFKGLNGGIVLVPDQKLHPKNIGNDLYILGEYHYDPMGFGRYVTIYYGSFCRTCAGMSEEEQAKKLAEVLYHELAHHLESLAGDNSLEIRDARDIAKYLKEHGGHGPGG